MIVIDASALVKYILREEGWRSVEKYLVKGVYSIDHIVKEVANAIWKYVIIHRVIDASLGMRLFHVLKRLIAEDVIYIEDQLIYLDKAMEIALKYRITVYDALYVAQALKYGELLTSDKRQSKVAEELGIKTYFI